MDIYHLYLDESETKDYNGNNRAFCMAGIIVKESDLEQLEKSVNLIKLNLWGQTGISYILHEKEIKDANNRSNRKFLHKIPTHYHLFIRNEKMRYLYNELSKIYGVGILTVIGACLKLDDLKKHFSDKIVADDYLICIQIILENFCHFLNKHNAKGYIHYESRGEPYDERINALFHHV